MGIFDKLSKYAEEIKSEFEQTREGPDEKNTGSDDKANNKEKKVMDKGADFVLSSSQKIANKLLEKHRPEISYSDIYDPEIIKYMIDAVESSEFTKSELYFELLYLSTNSYQTLDYCLTKFYDVQAELERNIQELKNEIDNLSDEETFEYENKTNELKDLANELASLQNGSLFYISKILKKISEGSKFEDIEELIHMLEENEPDWEHYLLDKFLFKHYFKKQDVQKSKLHFSKAIKLNPLDKDLLQNAPQFNENDLSNRTMEIYDIIY